MNIHHPLLKLSENELLRLVNERTEYKRDCKGFCVYTSDISRQLKSNLITLFLIFLCDLFVSLDIS